MKKSIFIILVISIALFSLSCSQKMPVPQSDNTGLLVIPVTSRNLTSYQYGYYYNFIYGPENEVEMRVVPLGSRNFVFIKNLPPGKYEISGIKAISSTNTGRGLPHVSSETTEFSRSIPIEINSNNVTLLHYLLSIEQKLFAPNLIFRYVQGFSFRPLEELEQKQIIDELQSLQNAELWNLEQLSASGLPDPDTGVVSTGELQLTWSHDFKN